MLAEKKRYSVKLQDDDGARVTARANVKSTLIPCPCDRSLNGDAIAERAV